MRLLNTPIMIDSFQHHPGITTYLLSHLHTDHTSGLSPSWNNGIIYTTKLSAFLLKDKFHVNADLIVELEYDECVYVDLTKGTVTQQKNSATCVQISVIDANHCVGSCMFLLEGYFGNILATGDFRFDSKILRHHALQNKPIDHLFLDDTFAEPEYVFPSRPEAGKQILNIIQKYPEHYRICVATDTLGKEELLVAIAMKFKSLVVVSEERLHQLNVMRRVIDLPDVFTSDQSQGRIVCLGKRQINFKSIVQMRQQRLTVGILPSGWSQTMLRKSTQNVDPLRKLIWRVGYSLHSSFPELETFVKTLKPRRLHSGSRHDDDNLKRYFQKYCSDEPPRDYVTPKAIQEAMISKIQQQAAIVTPRRSVNKKSAHLNTSNLSSGSRRQSKPSLSSSSKKYKRMRGAKIPEVISDDNASSSSLDKYSDQIVIVEDSDDDDSRGALTDDEEDMIHEIIDVESMDNEMDGTSLWSGKRSTAPPGTQQHPITLSAEEESGTAQSARDSLYAHLFSNTEDSDDEEDEEIARILGDMFEERSEQGASQGIHEQEDGASRFHAIRSPEVVPVDSDEDDEELGNLLDALASDTAATPKTSTSVPMPDSNSANLSNGRSPQNLASNGIHKRKRGDDLLARHLLQPEGKTHTPLVKRKKTTDHVQQNLQQQYIYISDSD